MHLHCLCTLFVPYFNSQTAVHSMQSAAFAAARMSIIRSWAATSPYIWLYPAAAVKYIIFTPSIVTRFFLLLLLCPVGIINIKIRGNALVQNRIVQSKLVVWRALNLILLWQKKIYYSKYPLPIMEIIVLVLCFA